jgi:hypothetical protein
VAYRVTHQVFGEAGTLLHVPDGIRGPEDHHRLRPGDPR